VREALIAGWTERQPSDDARQPLIIGAAIESDDHDDKLVKGGPTRKIGSKRVKHTIQVLKHMGFLL